MELFMCLTLQFEIYQLKFVGSAIDFSIASVIDVS